MQEDEKNDIYQRLNAFRPVVSITKKHPCKDCFNCLFCSDARCTVCLRNKAGTPGTDTENHDTQRHDDNKTPAEEQK